MATTTTSVKRITKAQRFADIKLLLVGENAINGTTIEDALAFCDSELALLAKKNSGDKKPTKVQEANEGYKALILQFLMTQTEGVTCTDILKGIPELENEGYGNQKVAALLRPMLDAKQVTKEIVKGRSLFSLA